MIGPLYLQGRQYFWQFCRRLQQSTDDRTYTSIRNNTPNNFFNCIVWRIHFICKKKMRSFGEKNQRFRKKKIVLGFCVQSYPPLRIKQHTFSSRIIEFVIICHETESYYLYLELGTNFGPTKMVAGKAVRVFAVFLITTSLRQIQYGDGDVEKHENKLI